MTTAPVPRLVGATWYPVPTPEGVPLTLGFPSEETCASFCEAVGPLLEGIEREVERRCDLFAQDHDGDMENEYARGFDDGREDGDAEGFDRGWEAGYAAAEENLVSA